MSQKMGEGGPFGPNPKSAMKLSDVILMMCGIIGRET